MLTASQFPVASITVLLRRIPFFLPHLLAVAATFPLPASFLSSSLCWDALFSELLGEDPPDFESTVSLRVYLSLCCIHSQFVITSLHGAISVCFLTSSSSLLPNISLPVTCYWHLTQLPVSSPSFLDLWLAPLLQSWKCLAVCLAIIFLTVTLSLLPPLF